MKLKNKSDGQIYTVKTLNDEGFYIFAVAEDSEVENFVMHYSSLAEFTDEWEDVE